MPAADPNRTVECIKLKRTLPALAKAPFPTDFGQYILDHVSKEAWDLWLKESVRYINTRGWDLSTKKDTEALLKELRIWLGIEEGEQMQTAWTPPTKDGA